MKVKNPLLSVDMPDPDLLRDGNVWYMVSTTMFFMPGGPILRSYDLCHWETVSYIFEYLAENEAYRLENGKNAYGKGQWATSLARRDGYYHACLCMQRSEPDLFLPYQKYRAKRMGDAICGRDLP